jgi:hypothetical protein
MQAARQPAGGGEAWALRRIETWAAEVERAEIAMMGVLYWVAVVTVLAWTAFAAYQALALF